jgi:hypothetical protein
MISLASALLGTLNQFKVLHWQTQSYARHKAFGNIHGNLTDLVDKFVEVYMGKYGRVVLHQEDTISLSNIGELNIDEFLDSFIKFLISFCDQLDKTMDSDLMNLKDEMIAEINQLRYLLTLK